MAEDTPLTAPTERADPARTLAASPRPVRTDPDNTLVVVPAGDIDLATAPSLQAALTLALQRHTTVCCDLREVTFFSAAGVTALILAANEADRVGSRLRIRGARGVTRRVLRITRVDDRLGTDPAAGRAPPGDQEPGQHPGPR